jgi:hypothetical protein
MIGGVARRMPGTVPSEEMRDFFGVGVAKIIPLTPSSPHAPQRSVEDFFPCDLT